MENKSSRLPSGKLSFSSVFCLSKSSSWLMLSGSFFMPVLYPKSSNKAGCKHFMWPIFPEVKTVQQPVHFFHGQLDCIFKIRRRCLEFFLLQALHPQAKTITLPVQNLDPVTCAIQEHKNRRFKQGNGHLQLH